MNEPPTVLAPSGKRHIVYRVRYRFSINGMESQFFCHASAAAALLRSDSESPEAPICSDCLANWKLDQLKKENHET